MEASNTSCRSLLCQSQKSNKSVDATQTWWKRLFKKRTTIEVRNYTDKRARVTICEGPYFHVDSAAVNVGVDGIASVGVEGHRSMEGGIHQHYLVVDRASNDRNGRRRSKKRLCLLTPSFYIKVDLLHTCCACAEYGPRYVEAIPWMLSTTKYNFNILSKNDTCCEDRAIWR